MYSSSLFILGLSALSSALPALAPRDKCEAPVSFTISGFTTFTPAEGNPKPAAVFFSIGNDGDSSSITRCSRTGNINAAEPAACTNTNTIFRFKNGTLTVGDHYVSCSGTQSQAFGDVGIATYCYPSQPPMPNGFGTQCQTPTGQLSGTFTRDTL
ncbi:hypothetical protein BJ875DRAFT_225551 [Amylocarpus encephaloides]|uniref:AA1-like domain-containing protein n=1 Tax=Amylocarpus encephaloides TaxID=45428 RepID=A0A9P7YNJ7_9HELO|nr:hypothetical protein BJ875DRAFT_225551 [Amylocarpus encephaloides]